MSEPPTRIWAWSTNRAWPIGEWVGYAPQDDGKRPKPVEYLLAPEPELVEKLRAFSKTGVADPEYVTVPRRLLRDLLERMDSLPHNHTDTA